MSALNAMFEALLTPGPDVPDQLISWNGSDPGKRFAVHRNNIAVSLVDAMADTFPVCQALVGEDFFRPMAQIFVRTQPPTSPVLAWYGHAFPDFVSHFPPAASVPYLADVARLEWMWVHAYHAADDIALDVEPLGTLLATPEVLPHLQMRFHPSASVIDSKYAIVSILSAHEGLRDIAPFVPDLPEAALIVRAGLEVECIPIAPAQASLFNALRAGTPLGRAIESTTARHTGLDLPQALGVLFSHPVISSITTN